MSSPRHAALVDEATNFLQRRGFVVTQERQCGKYRVDVYGRRPSDVSDVAVIECGYCPPERLEGLCHDRHIDRLYRWPYNSKTLQIIRLCNLCTHHIDAWDKEFPGCSELSDWRQNCPHPDIIDAERMIDKVYLAASGD